MPGEASYGLLKLADVVSFLDRSFVLLINSIQITLTILFPLFVFLIEINPMPDPGDQIDHNAACERCKIKITALIVTSKCGGEASEKE